MTGHFLQEDKLGLSTRVSGATMPLYEYEDIPGVDILPGQDRRISHREAMRQRGTPDGEKECHLRDLWRDRMGFYLRRTAAYRRLAIRTGRE